MVQNKAFRIISKIKIEPKKAIVILCLPKLFLESEKEEFEDNNELESENEEFHRFQQRRYSFDYSDGYI